MHSFVRSAVVLAAAAVLLTGCSGNPAPVPTAVAFELPVTLVKAGTDCDDDDQCWLPVQFAPHLVDGQSVSLFGEWPLKNKDTVAVICEISGQWIQNYDGEGTDKWYGILVPNDKIVTDPPPAQLGAKAKKIDGGVIGYVSAQWLAATDATAPPCKLVL